MNNALDAAKDNLENPGNDPVSKSLETMNENEPRTTRETTDEKSQVTSSEQEEAVENHFQITSNEETVLDNSVVDASSSETTVEELEVSSTEDDHETLIENEIPFAETEQMVVEEEAVEFPETATFSHDEDDETPIPFVDEAPELEEIQEDLVENILQIEPETEVVSAIEIEPVNEATGTNNYQAEEVESQLTAETESSEIPSTSSQIEYSGKTIVDQDKSESDEHEDSESEHVDDEILQQKLEFDYGKFSKKELYKLIEELVKESNPVNAYKLAAKMKPTWDSFYETAKHTSLTRFIEEGGESDSFEFRGDEMDQKAFVIFKKFREGFKAEQGRKKEAIMANLQTKLELVAKLRALVNSEDTNIDIKALREIQETWRRTGPVPPEQFENLNASYQFLSNKFYDNRSIFFEMLDLDRKKNLAAKEELIEKAGKLKDEPSIGKAVQTALQLQKEFQDVGPVPQEQREDVWNRFRSAMDLVFQRRKEHFELQKAEASKEAEAKLAILEKLGDVSTFQSDKFDGWANKTKEVQVLQEEWKTVKHVPGGKTEELTKRFWSEIKKFFYNKNEFFKTLDAIRNQNLQLKNDLIERADAVKDSENWDATTLEYKLLRDEWKTIGPIPYKINDAVYKRFNAAIDHFFERKKQKFNVQKETEKKNLLLKNELIAKVEALVAKNKGNMEDVETFREEFNSIGYVPHKDVGNVIGRFHKAIDDLILNSKDMDDQHKTRNRLKVQVNHAASSNEGYGKLQKQENYIRRRIAQLTDEIENLKNNLGFFANTKNAQTFLADYNKKIQLAELEIKELREQLKIIN